MARYTTSGTVNTVQQINAELEKIQESIKSLLARDGSQSNQMLDVLDMNSQRIINTPTPVFGTDVLRLQDLETLQGTPVNIGVTEDYIDNLLDPFDPKKLQIIAHRGFRNVDVQNTMLAFSKCQRLKAEVIEADLQVTADGHVVCFHDFDVADTTDGTGPISSLTLAEVQALKFDFYLTGTEIIDSVKIPTFDDLLQLCQRNGHLLSVEMKAYRTQADIGLMIDKLAEYDFIDKAVISSFQYSDSLFARAYNPDIRVGLIGGGSTPSQYEPLLDQMAADGIEFLIWSSNSFIGDSQVAEYARSKGLKIQAYTIRDVEDVEVCLRKGIYALITDVPLEDLYR